MYAIHGGADYASTSLYRLHSFSAYQLSLPNIVFFSSVFAKFPPGITLSTMRSLRNALGAGVHPPAIMFPLSNHRALSKCPQRRTGSSKLPCMSNTRTTPTSRRAIQTPTQVPLTSTTANAAASMTQSGVGRPLLLSCTRSLPCSHQDSSLTSNKRLAHWLNVGRQKYGDEVKAYATLLMWRG